MKFSERYGHRPVREVIQIDSVDEALRNSLWTLLKIYYWDTAFYSSHGFGGGYNLHSEPNKYLNALCGRLWFNYFKKPLDRLSSDWSKVLEQLRTYFFGAEWYEVYDFIEFIATNYPKEYKNTNERFMDECNQTLEKEMSAYRFVDGLITKMTDEEEVRAIEEAIETGAVQVSKHLRRSLELLSDRSNPDYRNSVKESISAIEALVAQVTGDSTGTLGQLLKRLEGEIDLHPALRTAFGNLYGFSSDESGIRHALSEKELVDFEDAKFMLVTCSAFVGYVQGKLKESV